jgi:hypothetical protein
LANLFEMLTCKRACRNKSNLEALPDDLLCLVVTFLGDSLNTMTMMHHVNRCIRTAMRSSRIMSQLRVELRHHNNILRLGPLALEVQKLRLKSCGGLSSMKYTPKVRILDLSHCNMLRDKGFEALESLSMLHTLSVTCDKLTNVDVLATLPALRHLNMSSTYKVANLPVMPGLKSLNIDGCMCLRGLEVLSGMPLLETISMSACFVTHQVLSALPANLTDLNLSYCMNLDDTGLALLGRLCNLTKLNVSGGKRIQSLRPLRTLTQLQELKAGFCVSMKTLEGLSALSSLRVFHAPHNSLETDDGPHILSGLKHLEEVNLSNCGLTEIGFRDLPALRSVRLRCCPNLQSLPNIGRAHSLQSLDLSGDQMINDGVLTELTTLVNLTELNLQGCWRITDLGLCTLPPTLEQLILHGCFHVGGLTGEALNHLTELQKLDVQDCVLMTDEGLHNMASMRMLRDLNLSQCVKVTDAGLFGLTSLRELSILRLDGCRKITDVGLRALAPLTKIHCLDFNRCRGLKTLRPLSALVALKFINLSGCVAVTDDSLLNLTPCRKLETIYTHHCKLVTKKGVAALYRAIGRQPVAA